MINDKVKKCSGVITFNAIDTICSIVPARYQDGNKNPTRNKIQITPLVLFTPLLHIRKICLLDKPLLIDRKTNEMNPGKKPRTNGR